MSVYPFVEAEKAERRNVAKACELLEVSRSAFYVWAEHAPCRRELDDAVLGDRIEEIHAESRGTYGAPRVHRALRHEGTACSRKRVARLMRRRGLIGRCRKRFRRTTVADPEATNTAVDLLGRAFGPAGVDLDRVWVGDIERHEALPNRAVMKGHRHRLVAASRSKLRAA